MPCKAIDLKFRLDYLSRPATGGILDKPPQPGSAGTTPSPIQRTLPLA